MCLIKLVKHRTFSQRYVLLLVGQMYAWKHSERFQLRAAVIVLSSSSLSLSKTKTLKEVHFADEELLNKEINNIDDYVDYGVTDDIPGKMHVVKVVWRFYSIEEK